MLFARTNPRHNEDYLVVARESLGIEFCQPLFSIFQSASNPSNLSQQGVLSCQNWRAESLSIHLVHIGTHPSKNANEERSSTLATPDWPVACRLKFRAWHTRHSRVSFSTGASMSRRRVAAHPTPRGLFNCPQRLHIGTEV